MQRSWNLPHEKACKLISFISIRLSHGPVNQSSCMLCIYAKCFQARDFDPDSLRKGLPKAVSLLQWAVSDGKGRVYVHCTAGLGRAPAVAIAYIFWFCNMNVRHLATKVQF